MMRLSERGIALIAYYEAGVSLELVDGTTPFPGGPSETPLKYRTVYTDKLASTPILTVGYGTTTHDVDYLREGDTYTHGKVVDMFLKTITRYENAVRAAVLVDINQNQFDALVSFTYNVGIQGLTSSTLLQNLNMGKRNMASQEFHKWVYAGGRQYAGLIKRRKAESELFLTPIKKVRQTLAESRTIKAAVPAAIVSGLTAAAPAIAPAREIASFIQDYTWVAFVALALSFCYIIALRVDDWRKGRR